MIESIKPMNCFVCGKEKQDFEVWSNKLVIGITYDSDFQNNSLFQLKPMLSSKECHWQPKLPAENLCLVT